MQFVIVTGMSGAGKSTALKFFEDIGFFCADNLPPVLLPSFADMCFGKDADFEKVAVGIDIRGGKLFDGLFDALNQLENKHYQTKIVFLDATDETLMKRYKETRRTHPLAKNESTMKGLTLERLMLAALRERATYIIDTSYILTRQLKEKINDIFLQNKHFDSLMITVMSFGYKYGLPSDSDMVFDVRFLPNPFYIGELKPLNGNDTPVRDYVMKWEQSRDFLRLMTEMVDFLIPNCIEEGRNQLVISVGCSGGKHRSVTLANALYQHLQITERSVFIRHRDILQ